MIGQFRRRLQASEDQAQALEYRVQALEDRVQALEDRVHALEDRVQDEQALFNSLLERVGIKRGTGIRG